MVNLNHSSSPFTAVSICACSRWWRPLWSAYWGWTDLHFTTLTMSVVPMLANWFLRTQSIFFIRSSLGLWKARRPLQRYLAWRVSNCDVRRIFGQTLFSSPPWNYPPTNRNSSSTWQDGRLVYNLDRFVLIINKERLAPFVDFRTNPKPMPWIGITAYQQIGFLCCNGSRQILLFFWWSCLITIHVSRSSLITVWWRGSVL